MPRHRDSRPSLLVRVCAELGAGKITEAFIPDKKEFVDGHCDHGTKRITVNPVHGIVDTCIHECLHRLYPEWSENYVRRTTTYIRRRMTDSQIEAFYEEYQRRKTIRKTRLRAELP